LPFEAVEYPVNCEHEAGGSLDLSSGDRVFMTAYLMQKYSGKDIRSRSIHFLGFQVAWTETQTFEEKEKFTSVMVFFFLLWLYTWNFCSCGIWRKLLQESWWKWK